MREYLPATCCPCNDTRPCFARMTRENGQKFCEVLMSGYPAGKCKFCKPIAEITGGKEYPRKVMVG